MTEGFPGGSDGKGSVCNVGDPGLIPGSGRPTGKGNGNPLQHSYLENPMDIRAWQASVHAVTKNWTWQRDETLMTDSQRNSEDCFLRRTESKRHFWHDQTTPLNFHILGFSWRWKTCLPTNLAFNISNLSHWELHTDGKRKEEESNWDKKTQASFSKLLWAFFFFFSLFYLT